MQCPWKWSTTQTYRVSLHIQLPQLRAFFFFFWMDYAELQRVVFKKGGPSGEAGLRGKPDRGNHTQLRPWQPIWLLHICRDIISVKMRARLWQLVCGYCRLWLEKDHFKWHSKKKYTQITTKGIRNMKFKALQIKTDSRFIWVNGLQEFKTILLPKKTVFKIWCFILTQQ